MSTLWDDVRYAVRTLAKRKSFAFAALLTLALGIGANAAIFSIVRGVLLRPLPYPDPDRLAQLWEEHPGGNSPTPGRRLSNLTFHAWSPTTNTIDQMAAYGSAEYSWRTATGTERINGASVSPSLFPILRVTPSVGRLLQPADDAEGAEKVVVLSDALWRERFGADPSIVGQSVTLDDALHTIVGVAPASFYFPDRKPRLWTVRRPPAPSQSGATTIDSVVARLRNGVTVEQAAAEGTSAARSVPRPFVTEVIFGKGGPVEVRARTFAEEMTAGIRPALLVLAGGVAFVLLIACANVANLFLSHGVTRRRELAMRVALGATRGRLMRQLLTESLVLSSAGGVAGLALGWALVRVLPALAPADFPRLDDVRMDATVLAFAAGVSLLAGVLSGLVPALRGAYLSLTPVLHDGSRGTGGRARFLRSALIVAESALAVMLLIGASLLARSFAALLSVDAGYEPANVLTARVFLPGSERSRADNEAFVERLLPLVRAWPEVVSAGAGNMSPFGNNTTMSGFQLPALDGQRVTARATTYVVTPGYAEALRLRVREGRTFEERDFGAGMQALVVNEEFVRSYFSDGQPVVGRQFASTSGNPDPSFKVPPRAEIIGVVGNVLKDSLDRSPQNEIYMLPTNGNLIRRETHLVLRTHGDPAMLAGRLRGLVAEVDPSAAVAYVGSLTSALSQSVAQPRFAASVLGAVASLGLLLSAIGLYGVLSYSVSERRREMGVRAALGASRRQLVSMIVRQGLGVTVLGVLLGLGGAAALSDMLKSVLFGVQPHDPTAFIVTPVVLLMVALLACVVPATRAAAVDPAEALKSE